MKKLRIVEAGNEVSLGGTEYVMQLYCKYLNKEYFDVTVVAIHLGGVRAKLIEDLGIPVVILNGDIEKMAGILQETDVFHWHCNGWMDKSLLEILKANRPKLVIHNNVFGEHYHSEYYDVFDFDLYVSNMILIRRIYIDRMSGKSMPSDIFASKRKVLANPVDVTEILNSLPSDEEVRSFKKVHDLEDQFIVGRIGRANNSKFDLITLDGFAEFNRLVSNTKFLLVGATPEILAHASSLGIKEHLIILEPEADLKTILLYYKALDIFLAASTIGESFGMAIAEAMTVGVPVVTVSDIDKDNAQIEIVDNNKTGLVVEKNSNKIADAIFSLYQDKNKWNQFSVSSRHKIIKEYKADNIVKSFETLVFNHFQILSPYKDKNLLKSYSKKMVVNYFNRCHSLWNKEN